MKNIIKFILSFICYIVLIPLYLGLTICTTWYVLPAFQLTQLGQLISQYLSTDVLFITTIACLGCTLVMFILSKLFRVVKNSKLNNLYTHVVTWLIALVVAAESIYTFFTADSITALEFELDMVRKIGIGAGVVAMLIYSIIAPKIRVIVDRKIQAYDTAKELNANGRSSVIFMQLLKTLDFACPELLLLVVLCFAFDFKVAIYFIYIICAFIIPIIGNMICDKRVKIEAIRKEEEKVEAQVNATAEAVADLLQQRGNNP